MALSGKGHCAVWEGLAQSPTSWTDAHAHHCHWTACPRHRCATLSDGSPVGASVGACAVWNAATASAGRDGRRRPRGRSAYPRRGGPGAARRRCRATGGIATKPCKPHSRMDGPHRDKWIARECAEAKRREDSAKPNPKGAQASACAAGTPHKLRADRMCRAGNAAAVSRVRITRRAAWRWTRTRRQSYDCRGCADAARRHFSHGG